MNEVDLRPEMLRPYDPRHVAQPPPDVDVCEGPVFNICVNTKWWAHCSGMISRLLYRDAWIGTESEIDDAIQSIYTILDVGEPTMSCGCGCGGSGLPSRYTSDGVFQVSYDGGVTWVDASNQDPRNNVTQLPPIGGEGGVDATKCKAANSAVAFLQQMQADTHARLQTGATVAAIAEAIIAFLVVIGIIATGGALAVLGGAIGAIAASSDATTFDGAFTSGVWADLLCAIYCAFDSDLTITQAKWNAIKSQVKADHPGIAGDYLSKTIDMMGAIGLQNATRLGLNAALDCSGCIECLECQDKFSLYHDTGITVTRGDGWLQATSVVSGLTGGFQTVAITTNNSTACCYIDHIEINGAPGSANVAWRECGEAIPAYGEAFGHNSLNIACTIAVNTVLFYNAGAAFTIKIFFSETPCA